MPLIPSLKPDPSLLPSLSLLPEDGTHYGPDFSNPNWSAVASWSLLPYAVVSNEPLTWKAQATSNFSGIQPETVEEQRHKSKTRIRGSIIKGN